MTSDAAELPPPPSWLAPLQDAFAQALRSPLDASSGTLRSAGAAHPLLVLLAESGDARARFTLYHEQYWMRLFSAMQTELPRFAQVVGYWRFNALATVHLVERPPTDPDLARAADGFAPWLLRIVDRLAGPVPAAVPDLRPVRDRVGEASEHGWERALAAVDAPIGLARQALCMDEAVRCAFAAPFGGIWRPTPSELEGLEHRRLRFAPSFRLLREDWSLARRAVVGAGAPEAFVRHARPQFWVSLRAPRTTTLRRVEQPLARFLGAARQTTLGEALAVAERASDERSAARLRAALPGWIQLASSSGWWTGSDPA